MKLFFLLVVLAGLLSPLDAFLHPNVHRTREVDSPLTWIDQRELLFYAYSSFCFEHLTDWTCFWCTLPNVTGRFPQQNVTIPALTVLTVFKSDGLDGTYGYVGYNSERVIVAFRGTASIENWIKDAEFWMTSYPGISGAEVHHGFLEAYNDVSKTIQKAVQIARQKLPNLPILVTGHSLGAALSMLCAMDLRLSGFNNVSLVNFGQPRVGNPQFVSKFQQMVPYYYRVVNKADPVPNIPPREFGYVHGAVQLWYPHDGYSFRVCNGGEDPTCSDSLYPWDWRPRDHTQYLAINQAIQNGHGCCGWPCAPGPVVLL